MQRSTHRVVVIIKFSFLYLIYHILGNLAQTLTLQAVEQLLLIVSMILSHFEFFNSQELDINRLLQSAVRFILHRHHVCGQLREQIFAQTRRG